MNFSAATINDIHSIKKKIIDQVRSKLFYYFAKESRFYDDHLFMSLYRRMSSEGNIERDDLGDIEREYKNRIKNIIFNKLFDIYLDDPFFYANNDPFYFQKTLMSIKLIEDDPLRLQKILVIDDFFIDTKNAKEHIDLNSVHDVLEVHNPYIFDRKRDLLISLVDCFNFDDMIVSGNWEKRQEERDLKRKDLKEKYVDYLERSFTARSLSLAINSSRYKDNDFLDIFEYLNSEESVKKINVKMNKSLWNYFIKMAIKEYCDHKNLFSAEDLVATFVCKRQLRQFISSVTEVAYNAQLNLKTRAFIPEAEIKETIRKSILKQISSKNKTGAYKNVFDINKPNIEKFLKTLPLKSSKVYRSIYKKLHLIQFSDRYSIGSLMSNDRYIIDLHEKMIGIGANLSTIRSFLQALLSFNEDSLNDSSLFTKAHDNHFLLKSILSLFSYMGNYHTENQFRNINKFLKFCTTNLANEENTKFVNSISLLKSNKSTFRNLIRNGNTCDFRSIDDYVSHLKDENNKKILSVIKNSKFKYEDNELIYNTAKSMMIDSGDFKTVLEKIKSEELKNNSQEPNPYYKKSINNVDLYCEILPFNSVIGNFGHAVPGVCIDYAGYHHLEHINSDCYNLIIRDSSKVYIWGLIVESIDDDEKVYFLNNIQGRLPSRYRSDDSSVKESIRSALNSFGEVYAKNHFFNSLNIFEDDEKLCSINRQFRLMRLDVQQDDNGHIIGNFHKS